MPKSPRRPPSRGYGEIGISGRCRPLTGIGRTPIGWLMSGKPSVLDKCGLSLCSDQVLGSCGHVALRARYEGVLRRYCDQWKRVFDGFPELFKVETFKNPSSLSATLSKVGYCPPPGLVLWRGIRRLGFGWPAEINIATGQRPAADG